MLKKAFNWPKMAFIKLKIIGFSGSTRLYFYLYPIFIILPLPLRKIILPGGPLFYAGGPYLGSPGGPLYPPRRRVESKNS